MKKILTAILVVIFTSACCDSETVMNNNEAEKLSTEQIFKALNDSLERLPHIGYEVQTKASVWDKIILIGMGDAYGVALHPL